MILATSQVLIVNQDRKHIKVQFHKQLHKEPEPNSCKPDEAILKNVKRNSRNYIA